MIRSCSLEYFRFIFAPTSDHFCKRKSTQMSRIQMIHLVCRLLQLLRDFYATIARDNALSSCARMIYSKTAPCHRCGSEMVEIQRKNRRGEVNDDIRERFGVVSIVGKMHEARLRRYVLRADDNTIAKRGVDLDARGRCPKGRPKERWMNALHQDPKRTHLHSDNADCAKWATAFTKNRPRYQTRQTLRKNSQIADA